MARSDFGLDPYGLDERLLPSDLVADLLRLIAAAEQDGLRAARAGRWRERLLTRTYPPDLLARCEQRLRGWLRRRAER